MRGPAENAELALLLEVSGTPKPGNVDRHRDHPTLRFEHFIAGAVGTRDGFAAAAAGGPIGAAFATAIEGMSQQSGGNTQFGAVLLLTPLVAAAGGTPGTGTEEAGPGAFQPQDDVDSITTRASGFVEETTIEDAASFYRAFEFVDVAVDEPPPDWEPLDVRRGADALPRIREREVTLADVMERSAERDGIAAEWIGGFERTAGAAAEVLTGSEPVLDRAAGAFLELLAAEPDTFVITQHDRDTAEWVRERAAAAVAGDADPRALADEFLERDINPGTTADIVAGGLFLALETGLEV